jgi:hypothetical protein
MIETAIARPIAKKILPGISYTDISYPSYRIVVAGDNTVLVKGRSRRTQSFNVVLSSNAYLTRIVANPQTNVFNSRVLSAQPRRIDRSGLLFRYARARNRRAHRS